MHVQNCDGSGNVISKFGKTFKEATDSNKSSSDPVHIPLCFENHELFDHSDPDKLWDAISELPMLDVNDGDSIWESNVAVSSNTLDEAIVAYFDEGTSCDDDGDKKMAAI